MVGLRELPTTVANHIIAGRSDVFSMAAAVESHAPERHAPERYAPERHGQERVSPLDADDGLPKAIHTLADVERMHILRVLDYTKGDRAAAAMYLDIGRTTLYRKLKEYGVSIET
jgi:DNA-binding NtrC family response regulator